MLQLILSCATNSKIKSTKSIGFSHVVWHCHYHLALIPKYQSKRLRKLNGEEDKLAHLYGVNAIPCPVGMDIESLSTQQGDRRIIAQ